jgi:hypothetical protein
MRAYGSDRVRETGGRIILHSRLPKGWVPRIERTNTSAQFPGTAILWDGQYLEVISADALPAGGVRYVLAPWRDEHAMRRFEAYDDASEARLLADHQMARRQRKHSAAARLGSMFLGHLPAPVQIHLGNELGVMPHRMTLLSILPVLALAGTCVWIGVSTFMAGEPSPIADSVVMLSMFMLAESVFRYNVAMTQQRGMGSLLGILAYLLVWIANPHRERWPSPFGSARGEKTFMLPPSEEVERADALEMRAPFLTLLTPSEQALLAERFGFDYRRHAYAPAWALLACGAIGIISSLPKADASVSGLVSLVVALLLVLEQTLRLLTFKRGPAGSVFGALVRPFARDLLERR